MSEEHPVSTYTPTDDPAPCRWCGAPAFQSCKPDCPYLDDESDEVPVGSQRGPAPWLDSADPGDR